MNDTKCITRPYLLLRPRGRPSLDLDIRLGVFDDFRQHPPEWRWYVSPSRNKIA
jgi:hypothetical protein